jgi:ParB-like chromosome segregation protein Spo0J
MDVEQVAVTGLLPATYNPRIMPAHEQQALARSLATFGMVEPIVANRHPSRVGIVVGGHQRLAAAISLGWATVPVVWVSLPEAAERRLNLALNNLSGRWDEARLASVVSELHGTPVQDVTGLLPQEISNLVSGGRLDAVPSMGAAREERCPRCRTLVP